MNGKRNPWEGVNLLPFIDAARMRDTLDRHCPNQLLTAEEVARNSFGDPIGSCLSYPSLRDYPIIITDVVCHVFHQSLCMMVRDLQCPSKAATLPSDWLTCLTAEAKCEFDQTSSSTAPTYRLRHASLITDFEQTLI
jgi:5'-3' exonuclease